MVGSQEAILGSSTVQEAPTEDKPIMEKIEEAITTTYEAAKEAISEVFERPQTESPSTLQQIEKTL